MKFVRDIISKSSRNGTQLPKHIWLRLPGWLLVFSLVTPWCGKAAGTWTPLANTAPGGVSLMLQLSDGSVMCQNSGNAAWYRLTPDIHGSYLNGTWTTIAPMHDSRRYYSSQVLRNGRVFVAGGEYGTGVSRAEIYDPVSNSWTQSPDAPANIIDNVSETLPNGDILEGSPGSDIRIYNIVSNTWSGTITPLGGQDEASWVKLQDGSILTIDPFGTSTERFIPSLNKWVVDATVPTAIYGWGGELGAGILLPNGKAIYFGGTNHTAIYTPWTTNYQGIYTPAGATNAGTWVAGPDIPNSNAAIDAPAAMMVNGKILCCMTATNNSFGNASTFYEYDYVANSFTQISGPTGGTTANVLAYGTTMLDLPDGTVLFSGFGSQLYNYKPTGTPLTNGIPTILGATTNLDGSFHLTGTLFNGISEGAAYGDDSQMNTDYPVARMTNAAGNILYCRTYNWSTCNLMTGTNVVSTEMTLPAGLLAGTYPLFVTVNGISSAAYSLTISGTPLPPVTGLAFTSVASNKMVMHWSLMGLTETGYVVQRSTDGANFSTLASLSVSTTNYTDNAISPLGQYYYRVLGTNSVGLGNATPAIFAASPPVTPVPAPWQSQDVGAVLGSGASGTNLGAFTVIGAGSGIGADNDQFQYVFQPVAGDVTITARVIASQNTGTNALAGVMIRNSPGNDVASALMGFNAASQGTVFEHRAAASGLAGYGLRSNGDPDGSDNGAGLGIVARATNSVVAPIWVRLSRTGNTIVGYTSPDGINWTPQGTVAIVLSPVVEVGLAVTSGTYNLLNTSTFDNVTVTGTPAQIPPPLAEWKLDETVGTIAEDSIDSFDGLYNNVVLGQPGATPDTGYSASFNGTSANISLPPLNLNSNVLTITAWVNRAGNENPSAGIFFNRAGSTVSGLTFNNSTANELSYTWNDNSSTYGWHSGLVVPANQWTFVALVIEPARARIFMFTNGVLYSATNNVANAVQAFDGASYIGQDTSSSSRYFKGQLDEVEFFNQALTPTQLAQFASAPVVTFSNPSSGSGFLAPATVNISVAVTATNGHAINLVQVYNNDSLIGQFTNAPYTNTLTNLAAGTYTLSARLFYDSGLAVSSSPLNIFVQNPAGVPPNIVATALASNLVNVTWAASTNASGYILSRNGSPIAQQAGRSFADFGLASGSNYCYSVVATNLVSSSASSASSCITTPATGTALYWNANSSLAGPQDGNGNWTSPAAAWWNSSANVAWSDSNIAVFGVNTATNCTVTLTNDVAPSGITFSVTGGGSYTIAGTSNILLVGAPTFTVDNDSTIKCPIFGTNNFNKTGSGNLILNNSSPAFTGTIAVNAGSLEMQSGPPASQIGYVVGTNGTLRHGYNTSPGYTKGIVVYGSGLSSATGLYVELGSTLSEQNITISNAPTTISSFGSGVNAQLQGFDINSDNFIVRSAASGSIVDTTVNLNVAGGYGMRLNIESGANTSSGDLVLNGLVVGGGNMLRKYGAGSLRLAGANTYSIGTIVNAGAVQLANSLSPLGSGPVNFIGNGTLQAVVKTYLVNNFSINSAVTMTVDTLTNSLTIAGAITNSGRLTKIGAGTLALGGANTYTGTTTVSAGTLQVDGSLGTTAVTVASTATLAGIGALATTPTLQSGSSLAPGDGNIGTLTFSNNLTLNSGTKIFMELSKNGVATSNDLVAVTGTLALAGTLTVTNIGPGALAAGDSFDLFNAGTFTGNFGTKNLPALATNLVWDTSQLASSGLIVVAAIPVITAQPQSLAVNPGMPANFVVSAAGNATLAYQWRKNGTNLPGVTLSSFTIGSSTTNDSADYTVVVTNNYGSVTSAVATLVVNVAPTILTPPQDLVVYVNSNATFNVTAYGNPAPAYQWYFNGSNLLNATAANLLIVAAQRTNEGSYTVVITNTAGAITSTVANLSLFREYGRAPLPYPSLLASNGARHLIVPGFQLGFTNIASTDARTNTSGDDGVTFLTPLHPGQNGSVQVVASAAGYLNGWMDFNTNGSWVDAGEQIFTNLSVTAGTNILNFNLPTNAAIASTTWTRFRFSSAANLLPNGEAPDGEVEDYAVAVFGNFPAVIDGGSVTFTSGNFSISGNGGAGQTYVLLTASNLVVPVWTPIATNVADTNGIFHFSDPGATNKPQQFYRLLAP